MTRLIGLAGPAGSGRDTVSRILARFQGFRRVRLEDPLISALSSMFSVSTDYFTDIDKKNIALKALLGRTPQEVTQSLSEQWASNNVHSDVLIELMQRKINYINITLISQKICAGVVVSDVKFASQANYIREHGGVIWHIRRPDNPYEPETPHQNGQHFPIAQLDGEPFILNDCCIEQLIPKVNNMFAEQEAAA